MSNIFPNKYGGATLVGEIATMYLRSQLKPDKTLIFDDLERSSLWEKNIDDLLGAINYYVEHLNFRVIIIANEEKILKRTNYIKVKEKVIGQTLKAESQTEQALEVFIKNLDNPENKSFINNNREIIKTIWEQSEEQSLRILKHIINDIGRLRSVLDEKYLENIAAKNTILATFCVYNINIRNGTLPNKKNKLRQSSERNKTLKKKYYTHFDDKIFSWQLIIDMLFIGIFDKNITEWLDQTSFFSNKNIEPWRIIINFDRTDDALLQDAISRMNQQIINHNIPKFNDFLHIITLRFMMIEEKIDSNITLDQEKQNFINYIDNIKKDKFFIDKFCSNKKYIRLDTFGDYEFSLTDYTKEPFEQIEKHFETC